MSSDYGGELRPDGGVAGLPSLGVDVIVDCGAFRCAAKLRDNGTWVDAFKGREIKGVLRWTPIGSDFNKYNPTLPSF